METGIIICDGCGTSTKLDMEDGVPFSREGVDICDEPMLKLENGWIVTEDLVNVECDVCQLHDAGVK